MSGSAVDTGSPAAQLAHAVSKLAKSPVLAMSGHAGTLKVVVEYLAHQERRLRALEDFVTNNSGGRHGKP